MNTPLNPTPTLLTLTAPPVERAPEGPSEGVFAEQLSAASKESGDPSQETEKPAPATERPEEQAAADEAHSAAVDAERSDDTPAHDEETGHPELNEEALLAVSLVSETIVAETSLNADLPEHAATTVDVGLPAGPATPIEVTPETEEGTDPNTSRFGLVVEESAEGSADDSESPAEPSLEIGAGAESDLEGEDGSDGDRRVVESAQAAASKPSDSADPINKISADRSEPTPPTTAPLAAEAQPEDTLPSATDKQTKAEPPAGNQAAATQPASGAEAPAGDSSANESAPTRESAPAANPVADSSNERPAVERSSPAESRPTVDPARFVSRVSRAIEAAHERGGGPIEIRLSPPELGSLRVQIEMKEGMLSASLEAETTAARNTLLDNLPALRERLEQQQIRLEKFDVDVRDDSQQRGGGGAPEGETQRRPDDSPDRREPTPERRAERESPTTESERAVATITFDDDGLNLVA